MNRRRLLPLRGWQSTVGIGHISKHPAGWWTLCCREAVGALGARISHCPVRAEGVCCLQTLLHASSRLIIITFPQGTEEVSFVPLLKTKCEKLKWLPKVHLAAEEQTQDVTELWMPGATGLHCTEGLPLFGQQSPIEISFDTTEIHLGSTRCLERWDQVLCIFPLKNSSATQVVSARCIGWVEAYVMGWWQLAQAFGREDREEHVWMRRAIRRAPSLSQKLILQHRSIDNCQSLPLAEGEGAIFS